MSIEVKVPSVGESITEGNLARWLKKDGDVVQADEPLFELETEKATGEVPAPAAGKLHITVPEGQKVKIGAVVGEIDAAASAPSKPARPTPKPATAHGEPKKDGSIKEPPPPTPAAQRLAKEEKADVKQVSGTGKRGQVLKEDVQKHLEERASPPPAPPTPKAPAGSETRQRMSAIRARIAERLVQAKNTTASLTTFNEVDLSAVMELRAKYKDKFKEKYDVGLGLMSFFVKAAVEALKAHPIVNARIDGEEIVYCNYYDLGVAVSTDKGLMVPVVRDADRLSFADIEKTIAHLAAKARDGKLAVTDLQGGTFTITNGGIFGSMLSTPILNPPQSAILGMHAIQKRPVARDEQIVIRPMMYLALTYDHRLIDGRDAVLFLVHIKECLENPERLLLEI
jgi:2-oxoglutarate dehydrogenase E2 component (dihydrolipoamide succinyltransferase)